jgi:hypothetical protein
VKLNLQKLQLLHRNCQLNHAQAIRWSCRRGRVSTVDGCGKCRSTKKQQDEKYQKAIAGERLNSDASFFLVKLNLNDIERLCAELGVRTDISQDERNLLKASLQMACENCDQVTL